MVVVICSLLQHRDLPLAASTSHYWLDQSRIPLILDLHYAHWKLIHCGSMGWLISDQWPARHNPGCIYIYNATAIWWGDVLTAVDHGLMLWVVVAVVVVVTGGAPERDWVVDSFPARHLHRTGPRPPPAAMTRHIIPRHTPQHIQPGHHVPRQCTTDSIVQSNTPSTSRAKSPHHYRTS